MNNIKNRGFASMTPERRVELGRQGGRKAHEARQATIDEMVCACRDVIKLLKTPQAKQHSIERLSDAIAKVEAEARA